MMNTPLGKFLTDLAENSDLQREYLADPKPVIAAAGLSNDARRALESKNVKEIRDALVAERGPTPEAAATVIVTIYTYVHVRKIVELE